MAHDTFLDRPTTTSRTSFGELQLLVLYRDASAAFAFFRVDPERAAAVLADVPVSPARFGTGTAVAVLAAYDYRDTSIGPYREVASALAVVPRGVAAPTLALLHLLRESAHEDVGWYVLDLPVTTGVANAGGRELYGLAKFETDIVVELAEAQVNAVVLAPTGEGPSVALEGRLAAGIPVGTMDLVVYSVLDRELLRTVVEARGRLHTGLGRALTLHVGGSDHPMARRLAALGLDGARPFVAQVCLEYRAVLNAPTAFRSLRTAGRARARGRVAKAG